MTEPVAAEPDSDRDFGPTTLARPWNAEPTEGWECQECDEWASGSDGDDVSQSATHHAVSTGHLRYRLWAGGWSKKLIDLGAEL